MSQTDKILQDISLLSLIADDYRTDLSWWTILLASGIDENFLGSGHLDYHWDRVGKSTVHGDPDYTPNLNYILTSCARNKEYRAAIKQTISMSLMRIWNHSTNERKQKLLPYRDLFRKYLGDEFLTSNKIKTLFSLETQDFITVTTFPDDSYLWLIEQINWAYKVEKLDSVVYLLIRKLLETALADIFCLKYGPSELDLFFNKKQRRFHNFSILLRNFEDRIEDFKPISQGIDKTFVNLLSKFREKGNASAHNILERKTRDELDNDRETINYLIIAFFRLINLIK
ncbi:MAG: hypothetical protein ACFFG0_48005 [Candidatus Thorarchaeota archaeon]